MARQQTLTKFLTNPSHPSVLRSKRQTKTVLDSDSSPNVSVDETDSDVPVTHLTQNPTRRCPVASSPPSRTRSANPTPMAPNLTVTSSSDGDRLEPVKWKRRRKLNSVIAESDSEDESPHKRRRLLQRGLKPDKGDDDDKPDPACKEATRLVSRFLNNETLVQ